ncbi:MAG: AbrB/MazE/SpoVT family DNA-binding domain-containing protein [Myxococcota bacterium]|nr:AbrB/MazE/SpoVT family DNA-binding domain-containing protein [Myxococcota bacterium]
MARKQSGTRKKPATTAPRTLRLGRQGRLVLPADLRRDLDLHEGDEVQFQLTGVKRKEVAISEVRRAYSGGRDLVKELIADRRKEARLERKAR